MNTEYKRLNMRYSQEREHYPNEDVERVLWEAKQAMLDAYELVGRSALVDYLEGRMWTHLMDGYVLREHYDTLARKYDIAIMSNKLLHGVVEHGDYASY